MVWLHTSYLWKNENHRFSFIKYDKWLKVNGLQLPARLVSCKTGSLPRLQETRIPEVDIDEVHGCCTYNKPTRKNSYKAGLKPIFFFPFHFILIRFRESELKTGLTPH
jgi:hypothetical protein